MHRRWAPALFILLAATQVASAEDRPKIAVLGLEVVDDGSLDAKTTKAAQLLTSELREQANRPGSSQSLAPNSDKDLLEMKLLSDCSDEGRGCMADIGRDLGADLLLYGKIEKRKKGYQVSLKLLNTKSESMEKSTSELISTSDLKPDKVGKWAKTLYLRLAGGASGTTLKISTNADSGTVYVDGNVKTTLSDGSAKVLGLSEGTHDVTIEANGYETYEATVAMVEGETEELSVSLTPSDGDEDTDDETDPTRNWKIAFFSGAIITTGLAGGVAYNGYRVRWPLNSLKKTAFTDLETSNAAVADAVGGDLACSNANKYDEIQRNMPSDLPYLGNDDAQFDPANAETRDALRTYRSRCSDGESAATLTNWLIGASVVSAVATAYFGYRAWYAKPGQSERDRRARRKKQSDEPTVRLAPAVGPTGLGANLAIEF